MWRMTGLLIIDTPTIIEDTIWGFGDDYSFSNCMNA